MSNAVYNIIMKILIADDDAQMHRAYQRMFDKEHELRIVSDGAQGLDAIVSKSFAPDIVFSDYDMGIGYMNGTSFCEKLRAAGCAVPFILISGNGDVRELAEKCGATFGIGKPVAKELLERVIEKFVPESGEAG
jgi:DNA-binding NtrC family response regulator